jgi:hypothetical protein
MIGGITTGGHPRGGGLIPRERQVWFNGLTRTLFLIGLISASNPAEMGISRERAVLHDQSPDCMKNENF